MESILDAYTARFGRAVVRHPSSWNGPCPLCGGEPGRSDRFMIWECRGEQKGKLGDLCQQHNLCLAWHCRRCGSGGDSIAYFQKVEGMTFREACERLGIALESAGKKAGNRKARLCRKMAPQEPPASSRAFLPKVSATPKAEDPEKWMAYAEKMLAEGQDAIFGAQQALHWLLARGLGTDAVREYRLGYRTPEGNARGRYRYRSALGLGVKERDGREVKKIFLPRGILIPTFREDGRLINMRTRRHNADVDADKARRGGKAEKYLSLEGGADPTYCLRSTRPEHLATYFIVEAELDAMLIHHVTGGFVGAVAIRSNRNKPDAATHALLARAARVAVALDFDEAGAVGALWWMEEYPTAVRWPVPEGKDPGDYFALGGDVRQWIRECLPLSSAVRRTEPCGGSVADASSHAQKKPAEGSMEASSGMSSSGGEGDALEMKEREERKVAAQGPSSRHAGFTPQEAALIAAAMPYYLQPDDVPQDVRRAWLLWRGHPIRFQKLEGGGWSWHIPSAWSRHHPKVCETFMAFQDKSRDLWDWLSDHADRVVSWRNLFDVAGGA